MQTNHILVKHLINSQAEVTSFGDEALIPLGDLGIAKADEVKPVVEETSYLARVQLMSAATAKCKAGDFPVNSYAYVQGQEFTDLTKEVDVLVIHWRNKALDMSGDEIISSYDADSEVFKTIQTKSGEADSKCMFGPEYLIYIPQLKKYATFFLGSKSSRKEARSIHQRLQKAATLKSKLIETKKFSWQSPVITPCSATFEVPPTEEMKEQVDKFNNPDSSNVEAATGGEDQRAR